MQGIPEYDSNPFICALPPIRSLRETIEALTCDIDHHEAERRLAPHLRIHFVLRLRRFFAPLTQHLDVDQKIALSIRQGYIGRNLNTTEFAQSVRAARARLRSRSFETAGDNRIVHAPSFAIIGHSGVGKSHFVKRVLSTYPSCIVHKVGGGRVTQVVSVNVDCPHLGSRRALCLQILAFLDEKLNTRYYQKLGTARKSAEDLVLDIQNLFCIHAVGLLVIDEIQNLQEARSDNKDALLSFLVLLVNIVGVPVIIVGTLGALPIFDSKFSQARRSSGLGSAIWFALPRGQSDEDEWPSFVARMWSGQWTAIETRLTEPLLDRLYYHTQGIIDLVIILYLLCQIRLIQDTAASDFAGLDAPAELITIELIDEIAEANFKLVRPMVNALRSGRPDDLKAFDDLKGFHEAIGDTLSRAGVEANARAVRDSSNAPAQNSYRRQTEAALEMLGYAKEYIEGIRLQLGEEFDTLSAFDLTEKLAAANQGTVPLQRPQKRRRSRVLEDDDLRQIVRDGRDDAVSPYEALRRAGVIQPLEAIFV